MQVLDFATPHSPKLHKNLHKRAPTQNRKSHCQKRWQTAQLDCKVKPRILCSTPNLPTIPLSLFHVDFTVAQCVTKWETTMLKPKQHNFADDELHIYDDAIVYKRGDYFQMYVTF